MLNSYMHNYDLHLSDLEKSIANSVVTHNIPANRYAEGNFSNMESIMER